MILTRRWSTIGNALLIVALLATLFPFAFTFINSIKYFRDIVTGTLIFTPTTINYERLFFSKQSDFAINTLNSLLTAMVTTVLVLVIATLAAYSL